MNEAEYWAERWRNHNTPWDMGRPHPSLALLVDKARPSGRVYIPACGRAHEGDWFARRGHSVVAEDIVPEAIDEARRLYGQTPGLILRVGNLFEVSADDKNAFDVVFDRAAFCAMAPDQWPAYLQAAADRLVPGGWLLSLPFSEATVSPVPPGPPFFIDRSTWERLVQPLFTIEYLAEHPIDRTATILKTELLAVARKK